MSKTISQTLLNAYDDTIKALRVTGEGAFSLPGTADAFTVELANGDLDVIYKFRSGGISGTVLSTVTLTYATAQTLTLVSGVIS